MSRFLRQSLTALDAYTPGEQPQDMAYIKLNTNESPYPPAPAVLQVLNREQGELLRLYPDPTGRALKESLAGLYGLAPENVFLGNGSDEILNFAFLAFGQRGAVFPQISYGFYQVYGQLYNMDVRKIPLKEDFSLNCRDYCGQNRLVVIANPNAPTGMAVSAEEIRQIPETNRDSVVLIDEAYVDFGGESCLPLIRELDNLLVVRTFSKSRCLAGGRLGYAFGNPELIRDLEKIQYSTNPYNINRLTLALGQATVEAEDYYRALCARIMESRRWTKEQLEALGFAVLPSQANFLFAKHPGIDGLELYRQLKQRGILVRHFTSPEICQYNRITIGTRSQMEVFVNTVKQILSGGAYENL